MVFFLYGMFAVGVCITYKVLVYQVLICLAMVGVAYMSRFVSLVILMLTYDPDCCIFLPKQQTTTEGKMFLQVTGDRVGIRPGTPVHSRSHSQRSQQLLRNFNGKNTQNASQKLNLCPKSAGYLFGINKRDTFGFVLCVRTGCATMMTTTLR